MLYNFRYFPFSTYITHNLEHYIKQKLLKNVIWGRHYKILAKRKVFLKWENVCHFGLGTQLFTFASRMVATPCWVFTKHSRDFWLYNKLIVDLACSVCTREISYPVFCTDLGSLRSLDDRSSTKKVVPIFHYSTDLTLGGQ